MTESSPPSQSGSSSSSAAKIERRDFFRISQDVFFDYKLVESFVAENDPAEGLFSDMNSMTVLDELKRIDKEHIQTLRLITEKNRLLGDYLGSLNQKIDLVTRHLLLAQDDVVKDKKKTRINLSEDGLAFMADRAIYRDSYIAVRLIFLPNYSTVTTFAKVVRSDSKEERFQVAAKFYRLDDADRQELSRQILKAQSSARKAKAR